MAKVSKQTKLSLQISESVSRPEKEVVTLWVQKLRIPNVAGQWLIQGYL